MPKKNKWIVEVPDSGINDDTLAQYAKDVDKKELYKLLYQSQYKAENQGLYIAKYDSFHPDSETFDAEEPYDTFLDKDINVFLDNFDHHREEAQKHFHQEMTVGYLIEYYISLLHRRFENHQDDNSLVLVNGYEKEID